METEVIGVKGRVNDEDEAHVLRINLPKIYFNIISFCEAHNLSCELIFFYFFRFLVHNE